MLIIIKLVLILALLLLCGAAASGYGLEVRRLRRLFRRLSR